MLTQNLGYPRIGGQRQLKKASENYWAGKIGQYELNETARKICEGNWQNQLDAGVDLIACNDFRFYDQVLDTSLLHRGNGIVTDQSSRLFTSAESLGEPGLRFKDP